MTTGTVYSRVMAERNDDQLSRAFVQRLQDEQARLGLGVTAFARLLGVDHGHLSRWFSAAREPRVSIDLAARIAERLPELGVSIVVPSGTDNHRRITDASEGGTAA